MDEAPVVSHPVDSRTLDAPAPLCLTMARLGLQADELALSHPAVMPHLARACRACPDAVTCEHALASGEPDLVVPAAYCPNADLLEQLAATR